VAVYLSNDVVQQLDHLQDELYEHLTSDGLGRCAICHRPEPCPARDELTAVILGYGALPRRRPGLTKAGLRRAA